VLVLNRDDVRALINMPECIDAIEDVLRAHAAGNTIPPGILAVHVGHGGFHVKTAGVNGRFVAKVNANFPRNPASFGLPTIQGVIALFDAELGIVLGVMDSIEITSQRTAGASAVAARYLAREDASSLAIIGCGEQGRSHVRAMRCVRDISAIRAFDTDAGRLERFISETSAECGIDVAAMSGISDAEGADIIVTCTTSTHAFLGTGEVAPGAFVAAVGADNPHKSEIEPALMAAAVVIVDSHDQAATIGDLHHAIEAGAMSREVVRAELAEVVAGRVVGRRANDEVIVFDSTGTALLDVALASRVHDAARGIQCAGQG
jgi:ornithine cyclodeaminase/alanine dehydrogenase-like protein (mu-crystallin family)